MALTSTLTPLSAVKQLKEQGHEASAALLSSMLLAEDDHNYLLSSSRQRSRDSAVLQACLGDALYVEGHMYRALEHYRRALSLCGAKSADHTLNGGTDVDAATLRKKIARCQLKHGDKRAAIRTLESLPPALRDSEASATLGRLYIDAGAIKPAQHCLRDALQRSPLAVEVALLLVEAGTPSSEVIALMAATAGSTLPSGVFGQIQQYLKGVELVNTGELDLACGILSALQQRWSSCASLCLTLALAEYERYVSSGAFEARERSMSAFRAARSAEPWLSESMDDYASLLHECGRNAELSSLCATLLEVDALSPAAWRTSAILCDANSDQERAHRIDSQLSHVRERARRRLHPHITRASSMVSAAQLQLDLGRHNEAYAAATSAIRMAPQSAIALTVYAKVLCATGRKDRGRQALSKALRLSPVCGEAAMTLAREQYTSGDAPSAMDTLRQYIGTIQTRGAHGYHTALVKAHTELASIMIHDRAFEEAAKELAAALAVEPKNAPALRELRRLDNAVQVNGSDVDEGEFADSRPRESARIGGARTGTEALNTGESTERPRRRAARHASDGSARHEARGIAHVGRAGGGRAIDFDGHDQYNSSDEEH